MFDKFLWRTAQNFKTQLAATIGGGILGGCVIVLQAFLLSSIVTAVFLEARGLNDLWASLVVLLGVFGLRALFSWVEETFALKLAHNVQNNLTEQILAKVARLGPLALQEQKTGELINLLSEGLNMLDVYFRRYLPQLFKCAVLPFIFLLVVFPNDWLSGLILLLTTPLVPLFMMLIGKWTQTVTKKQWRVLERLSGYLQDVLCGLATLKMLGHSNEQGVKIAAISDDFRRTSMSVLRIAFLSALTLELITTLSIALLAVGLGVRLVEGSVGFGVALFLILLAPEYYQPLRSLGVQYHGSINGVAVAKTIADFLALPEPPQGADFALCSAPPSLELRNVSYEYEQGRQALKNCNLHVASGSTLALCGASGGGKSTILNLLAAFLRPNDGAVYVNGADLADFNEDAFRRNIAVIPQQPYIFAGTVRENILLGNPTVSAEKVAAACVELGAHGFITALPQGYDTPIGQGGEGLSGGQQQLIAIARAYLKDAPLVLCDEATQGLDLLSEELVCQALNRLLNGKTAVIAAHRLSTIAGADKIAVIEQGSVVEYGTAEELRAANGAFANLLQGGAAHA